LTTADEADEAAENRKFEFEFDRIEYTFEYGFEDQEGGVFYREKSHVQQDDNDIDSNQQVHALTALFSKGSLEKLHRRDDVYQ
jgi:hypothetical protein